MLQPREQCIDARLPPALDFKCAGAGIDVYAFAGEPNLTQMSLYLCPSDQAIEIKDRFGNPVVPREWFLVPRFVVDDAVERIKDGTITDYIYDPAAARLVRTGNLA